jgi:hypothetical protein
MFVITVNIASENWKIQIAIGDDLYANILNVSFFGKNILNAFVCTTHEF